MDAPTSLATGANGVRRGDLLSSSGRGGRVAGGDQATSAAESRAEALKRRLARLALDVHDGPMQNLAVIGLDLNALRGRIKPLVPAEHYKKVDAGVEQILDELVQVEQELRGLLAALEDGAADRTPLLEGIEAEISGFKSHSGATVDLILEGHAEAETASQRIALRSIARAALANIAKHADARTVTIRLNGTPDTITLQVEDDGRGFASDEPTALGHFGVAGMRQRAELLGGNFDISSRRGGPTVVTATLGLLHPLRENPAAAAARGPA